MVAVEQIPPTLIAIVWRKEIPALPPGALLIPMERLVKSLRRKRGNLAMRFVRARSRADR
jgi:hypothetical protein